MTISAAISHTSRVIWTSRTPEAPSHHVESLGVHALGRHAQPDQGRLRCLQRRPTSAPRGSASHAADVLVHEEDVQQPSREPTSANSNAIIASPMNASATERLVQEPMVALAPADHGADQRGSHREAALWPLALPARLLHSLARSRS
jgi:hypothetical protein